MPPSLREPWSPTSLSNAADPKIIGSGRVAAYQARETRAVDFHPACGLFFRGVQLPSSDTPNRHRWRSGSRNARVGSRGQRPARFRRMPQLQRMVATAWFLLMTVYWSYVMFEAFTTRVWADR